MTDAPEDRDDARGEAGDPLVSTWELLAAGAIVLVTFLLIGGALIGVGATGIDDPGPSPTVTPNEAEASLTPTPAGLPVVPGTADEEAIAELARLSIELLPEGRWPELYNDFTDDFRARCSAADFAQAGVDSADELGDSLALLGYVGLRELTITQDSANAIIIGEVRGQSEYEVEAFFRRDDGAWKIAPAPGSTGCSAFNRL